MYSIQHYVIKFVSDLRQVGVLYMRRDLSWESKLYIQALVSFVSFKIYSLNETSACGCIPDDNVGAGCTTVISDTYCPYVDGFVCKPHVISSDFHSIYGNCHNTSVHDVTTTESDFTTEVTTTEGHDIIVNHPPVIHINHLDKTVRKNSRGSRGCKSGSGNNTFYSTWQW